MPDRTSIALRIVICLFLSWSTAAHAELQVTEWVSPHGPLYVRSGIIEGPTEIGLVDTQFTRSNTLRLAADLLETGKSLAWVYVTHPHLDHFNGAALLRHVFPKAKFYAYDRDALTTFAFMVRTRQDALGANAPGGRNNLPYAAPSFFEPLQDRRLTVDGEAIEVMAGPGDHPNSSVIWIPSARTFITGDVVFSETHAFLGDHRDIQGWIELIERMRTKNPARVVVGHGPPAVRRTGQVLSEQLDWLRSLQAAIDEDDTLEHVQRVMVEKYPGWANAFIFPFSYGVERETPASP
ncbi:MAG: MBL fold metallo-hydrolase [Acidobacteriota bacterium]